MGPKRFHIIAMSGIEQRALRMLLEWHGRNLMKLILKKERLGLGQEFDLDSRAYSIRLQNIYYTASAMPAQSVSATTDLYKFNETSLFEINRSFANFFNAYNKFDDTLNMLLPSVSVDRIKKMFDTLHEKFIKAGMFLYEDKDIR